MNNYARVSSEQWEVIQRQRQVMAKARRPSLLRRIVTLLRGLRKGAAKAAVN